jgi:hypothetical protein
MFQLIRRHLTYANVTVTALVFVVLGGGAYAMSIAPKNSVVSSSIKNGQVRGADVKESSLGIVPSANPAAFARVSSSGAVDVALTKGVPKTGVSIPVGETAVYCFHGLRFRPRGGQATIDYTGNSSSVEFTEFGLGAVGGCPAGAQAFVWIHDSSGGSIPAPFFVVFYR